MYKLNSPKFVFFYFQKASSYWSGESNNINNNSSSENNNNNTNVSNNNSNTNQNNGSQGTATGSPSSVTSPISTTNSSGGIPAMPVPGGVQGQNPTQGLVHWMSAVMAEHMTSNSHHDPAVGMHYMWNGAVDVSTSFFPFFLLLLLSFW